MKKASYCLLRSQLNPNHQLQFQLQRQFISAVMTKRFDPWISIFRSYEGQHHISCKILVFGAVCKKLLKTAPLDKHFPMIAYTFRRKHYYETLCFCIATELSCIYKGIQLITAKYVPQQTCQLALRTHSDVRETSGFVITTEPLGFVLTKQVNDFQLRVQPPIHCVLVGKLETPVLWHVTILSALILAKPAIITTMLGY